MVSSFWAGGRRARRPANRGPQPRAALRLPGIQPATTLPKEQISQAVFKAAARGLTDPTGTYRVEVLKGVVSKVAENVT